jgi:hypothetical protein
MFLKFSKSFKDSVFNHSNFIKNEESELNENLKFYFENKNYFEKLILPSLKQIKAFQVDNSKKLNKVKLFLYSTKQILIIIKEKDDQNLKVDEIISLRGYFPKKISTNYPLFNNDLFPLALMTNLNNSMINIDRLFFFEDVESQDEFYYLIKKETNHQEFQYYLQSYVSLSQF